MSLFIIFIEFFVLISAYMLFPVVCFCDQAGYCENQILYQGNSVILSRRYELIPINNSFAYKVKISADEDNSYNGVGYTKLYRIEADHISQLSKDKVGSSLDWVYYLTPGLRNNTLGTFGILYCPSRLDLFNNYGNDITCNYWELEAEDSLAHLFLNPHDVFLNCARDSYRYIEPFEFAIGGFHYDSNRFYPKGYDYKKALIVGYADRPVSLCGEENIRYNDDEIVLVNSIYSILRAINIQKLMKNPDLNLNLRTMTYFLSDMLSSSNSSMEARDKERRVEVYYFNGDPVDISLIHRCAKMLKNNLHDMDDSWYEKILAQMTRNKTEAEKEIIKDEFWNAVAILREVIKAKDIKPLEELLDTDDLANYRKKTDIQRAQTGYASVY
ncbi:hypothetical protein [Maridesulfovibrio sp.]|uniref:hypothetical protein n=1 Tax=Maridesulfovibrio sp. TaxID=2795000 RepID=UPI0029F5C86B|nr:hypothetical protein [Maridesulfovibrio sp.]